MTSQAQVPGASAVMLYHEESLVAFPDSTYTVVNSIKILNSEGRDKYSTVTIEHPASRWNGFFSGSTFGMKVDGIVARTIHADGTIIPFTGKPYEHQETRTNDETIVNTVISLPDVQVGSIVQYQYTIHDDYGLPTWYTERELFVRHEHFFWNTMQASGIAYTAAVPGGNAAVKVGKHGDTYTADFENVMPRPDEPFMPPLQSFTPRVIFYSFYNQKIRTNEAYWTETGKKWSESLNQFLGKASSLSKTADLITSGATTQNEKLRKIYVAIMEMENTRFTRTHSEAEDKAAGFKKINNVGDVLKNKRGSDDQLTALFVALARASGFKAYLMLVTARDRGIFFSSWLSYSQFDDLIAIVEVDGKEQYFDPGQRFCPYGQLQWTHTAMTGLRQTAKDPVFAATPAGASMDSQTKRVAELTLDKTGHESGYASITYTGARALDIRQKSLKMDTQELHRTLEDALQDKLPVGTEVHLREVDGLTTSELPLVLRFEVKGPLGVMTSKRMIIPQHFMQARSKMLFPGEHRETPVYFEFPERVADAVRLRLPQGWSVEVQPTVEHALDSGVAVYASNSERSDDSITLRRDYVEGSLVVMPKDYAELRKFFLTVATKDQEPIVLQSTPLVSH